MGFLLLVKLILDSLFMSLRNKSLTFVRRKYIAKTPIPKEKKKSERFAIQIIQNIELQNRSRIGLEETSKGL